MIKLSSGKRGCDLPRTKPLPRPHPTPRVHCNIGVLEIKTRSRPTPEEQDIANNNASVDDAVVQAVDYAMRLTTAFSLLENMSTTIAIYVVYGKFYTKVTTMANGFPILTPWQHVFEEFSPAALAQGRAPMSYRLCELAVRHWAHNGKI